MTNQLFTQILLVFAFVFFCIGIFANRAPGPAPAPWYWRLNIVSAGLALWVLVTLISAFGHGGKP
jgi:uncharacterized RDD family membrane protein YckC